jgi:hypothetical protein
MTAASESRAARVAEMSSDLRAVAIQGSAAETVAAAERLRAYVSPYGQPCGLSARLARWAERMGTDRSLPWAGLGIIGDLKLAASILNLREFAEYVRTNGAPEHRQWADDILRLDETADAVDSALCRAGLTNYVPPAGVETLQRERDAAVREVFQVRQLLVGMGVLDEGDNVTPMPDLLRALLA